MVDHADPEDLAVHQPTSTGAERLRAQPDLIRGHRIGLITNYTAVMPDLSPTVDALRDAGVPITALFGPEHGVGGTVQAGESESATQDPDSGLPLYDTYRRSGRELDEVLRTSQVDALAVDLQDIGTRFYTYIWTMYDMLASAARLGLPFTILDRPNPISGQVAEGPLLEPPFASFVGRAPIPLRHGLTIGELARYLNATTVPAAAGRPADLTVITMHGWSRSHYFDNTGLPWVMPSVNIPTLDSALAYPGTGLFEGTNLSEGRGTTRPFELVGAPYVDARWAAALNERNLPGVRFRSVRFSPTFHKYAGETLRGVQLHVTDRSTFAPVRTGVSMLQTLRELYPEQFGWRAVNPEGTHPDFVDLLWGSDTLRHVIGDGMNPEELLLLAGSREPVAPALWAGTEILLYPGSSPTHP
ncbi:exo-beta-N-acetylmuramidase NamZ family protein [Phytoactinopolyspora limicola]|uniref:exo-beta-N-acetylmuramidase NamZ family protein n=1 Tax=Phytoactinopolyspora limicola TaxID=2715536 RepID=UPI00140C46DC|nr:DUF1343 domain-containing protein [Phytoactinopolyspora limicola]